MPALDCPFQKAREILRELTSKCDILLVDFHAETTSEKAAMAYYLDGEINALVGTHTHVQTADERILPKGTAFISDLGMVGPVNSVIGVEPEEVLKKFLLGLPAKFDVAKGPCVYSAVVVDIDDTTNRTVGIERVLLK